MDNNQEPEKELSLESIDKSLSSLKGTIDNITNTQINELSSELGATPEQIEKKIQVLNSLYSAYNRLKNAILGLEKTKNEQATIQQIYEDYKTKGMTQKPPYSLTFRDSIQAKISAVTKNIKNIQRTIEILKKNNEKYQKQISQGQKEIRQFKEKFDKNSETQSPLNLLELEIREISVQYLEIIVRAIGIELNRQDLEKNNAGI